MFNDNFSVLLAGSWYRRINGRIHYKTKYGWKEAANQNWDMYLQRGKVSRDLKNEEL